VGGGLLVAAALSPARHGLGTFAWNAASWWIPEGLALGLLILLRARPAVVGGASLGWSAFLLAFWVWLQGQSPAMKPVVLYVYAIPGGWAGAGLAWLAARRRPARAGVYAGAVAGLTVALGLFVGARMWGLLVRA
jgi:hypothetical protein